MVKFLKKLKPESVKAMNADFLLNELGSDEKIVELISEARRVLVSNGRLFLTEDIANADDFKKILEAQNFRVYSRPLTQEERNNPTTLYTRARTKSPFPLLLDSRKMQPVTKIPIRIMATKIRKK